MNFLEPASDYDPQNILEGLPAGLGVERVGPESWQTQKSYLGVTGLGGKV